MASLKKIEEFIGSNPKVSEIVKSIAMKKSRCPGHCNYGTGRREFIRKSAILPAGSRCRHL